MKRILALQLKRIGDCILTAPAAAALRAAHPQAEIVMIVPQSVADLAACFKGVDRVLAYRPWSFNAAAWASVLVGEWDACYDFTGTDRSALMARLSNARERHGYAKFAKGLRAKAYTHLSDASVRDLHTVDFHLSLIGPPGPNPASGVCLSVPERTDVPSARAPFVIVHIGTAREEKFWPAERWAEVIHDLMHLPASPTSNLQSQISSSQPAREQPLTIVLTGTNTGIERPHLDKLRALIGDELRSHRVLDLTGQLSLVQLAALIAKCDLALGVDSMAMHLAAMFEKPQLVLFGPTNPFHWRPRHTRAVVLAAGHAGPVQAFDPRAKGAPMELISTRMVVDAIHRGVYP